MADIAHGVICPNCGTFTACAGSFKDENLIGTCGLGHHVVTRNLWYNADLLLQQPEPEELEPEPTPKEEAELQAPEVPKTFGRVSDGI